MEVGHLTAARAGDRDAFAELVEPYRRELLIHCYRMLGSFEDAEDILQETLLRDWRRLETFQRHVSFRAWLYKIATNVSLDALDQRPRRILPSAAYPAADPRVMFAPPVTAPVWLEPLPDELWTEAVPTLEARYSAGESVTLAFLAALQLLPPRQRAVLIMRDVLDFSSQEVADSLALTVAAANSALQRARATLAKHFPGGRPLEAPAPRPDQYMRTLLDQYVRAWEAADVGQLVALLRQDAILNMPPTPSWYAGRDAIGVFMAALPFSGAARGRWRLASRRANAQPAFDFFRLDRTTGEYEPVGMQVLTIAGDQITALTVFLLLAFFVPFGFAPSSPQAARR